MKGEVICDTTGNPGAQTKENEAIQLETTHLHYASAQRTVAKSSADGKRSQLCLVCVTDQLGRISNFNQSISLIKKLILN